MKQRGTDSPTMFGLSSAISSLMIAVSFNIFHNPKIDFMQMFVAISFILLTNFGAYSLLLYYRGQKTKSNAMLGLVTASIFLLLLQLKSPYHITVVYTIGLFSIGILWNFVERTVVLIPLFHMLYSAVLPMLLVNIWRSESIHHETVLFSLPLAILSIADLPKSLVRDIKEKYLQIFLFICFSLPYLLVLYFVLALGLYSKLLLLCFSSLPFVILAVATCDLSNLYIIKLIFAGCIALGLLLS